MPMPVLSSDAGEGDSVTEQSSTGGRRDVTPAFRGVDHASLTVTDLSVSESFYTEVLGFMVVLGFENGLLCLHKATGFTLGLLKPADAVGTGFSHLQTGLDHLALAAESRDELVAWEERFRRFGVQHSPIQDEDLGSHLNFRDPDGIALELYVPAPIYSAARDQLRAREVSDDEVRAMAAELGVGEHVARGR